MAHNKGKSEILKKTLIVQKYGGATLSDPQKIKSVAKRIAEQSKTHSLIVVVSAMGKTTNDLIHLSEQVCSKPDRREMDMLLSAGERISMSLVSMALNDLGCPAISFTGSQAGILTDESHFNANIIDVKAQRVEEAITQGKVVILAGFQGVSPKTKEITTLGRGGSDTTAVAMAAYLSAERCEILKDVAGVYSADPKLVPEAKPIEKLSYDQLLDMTFWGAKVLHHRSVALAKAHQVPIYIGPASNKLSDGSLVTALPAPTNSPMNSNENRAHFPAQNANPVLSINSHEKVLKIKGQCQSQRFEELFSSYLERNEIATPTILKVDQKENHPFAWIAGPAEILRAIEVSLSNLDSIFSLEKSSLCSVTVTFQNAPSKSDVNSIKKLTSQFAFHFEDCIESQLSLSFILNEENRKDLIQALHQSIN